jgi:hypothetical protein
MIDWAKITLKDLAGYVSEELRKRGIETILVGGACVTIYSNNRYQSYDLDYITYEDMKKVKKVLKELGFVETRKYFQHKDCPWFIEFVSPPVAVANQPIQEFNKVQTLLGEIKMLRPVDSVKDRLASFYHWNDKQGLEQALNICNEQDIDFNEVEKWSLLENQSEKFNTFIKRFKKIKEKG